ERDVNRLIDGLRSSTGATDTATLTETIARLPKRTFVLHNVHDSQPVVFQTRWVMSYLAGPLSRDQLRQLSSAGIAQGPGFDRQTAGTPGLHEPAHTNAVNPSSTPAAASSSTANYGAGASQPILPPHVAQLYGVPRSEAAGATYFPSILGVADVHYSSKTHRIEHGQRVIRLVEP